MSRELKFTVTADYDGRRVLHFLRGSAKLSSKLVRRLKTFDDGIMLNGEHARTVDAIHTGDIISVNIPNDEAQAEAAEYPLDIVYEDEDILVINKSPFIAMHPTHNHQGDTVANAVAWHLNSRGKSAVFRAIGRLDKGTSGLIVCALNPYSASRLTGNFKKEYLAVVNGILSGDGVINEPIIRPDARKTLRACGEGGEPALTRWEAVSSGNGMTLVRVNPETGKTHQIRVHFSHIGHILVGDVMYGDCRTDIGHQLLHCGKMTLTHPVTGEVMTFTAPPPEEMQKIIAEISGN
ncbi:MAG: RluA family pseudouridine synthase [Clostridiales bacterium]|nr:RluA family pseudouridine synthase [Clostridiales bacterium]